jgi:hypothetical protein
MLANCLEEATHDLIASAVVGGQTGPFVQFRAAVRPGVLSFRQRVTITKLYECSLEL